MKKLIISVILFITIISFPILSQTAQNVYIDVNCPGSSLVFPEVNAHEDMGTITATDPPTWQDPQYGTVVIEWTFMGDGTEIKHVNITQWDQVQNYGGHLGAEFVEIDSYWSADAGTPGETTVKTDYKDIKTANNTIPVTLDHKGCSAEGKVYLTITKVRASSYIRSDEGPAVFTFMISAID